MELDIWIFKAKDGNRKNEIFVGKKNQKINACMIKKYVLKIFIYTQLCQKILFQTLSGIFYENIFPFNGWN